MAERILLVGFDASEAKELSEHLPGECVCQEVLPRILVEGGQLFVEAPRSAHLLRIQRVIFHGIFEHDLEFLAGLALWGGPCFPNPRAMMDCRLRLNCLVHALRYTRYGGQRGYASSGITYESATQAVAKWGNWHCGENKERFSKEWIAQEPTLFEPFVAGEAVRVIMLNDEPRQIRMTGSDWKKSVHGTGAVFMELDERLASDTRAIRDGLHLDIIANDYIIAESGPYLLEVNHIPSVTCLPELWQEYVEVVSRWAST